MKSRKVTVVFSFCLIFCLLAVLASGCGKSSKESESVVITIGDLTDLSGPSSAAIKPISWALEDYVNYVNENHPIPGVELKYVQYDTKYDPSRFLAGYEWLKEQGADVIHAVVGSMGEAIKESAARDGIPVLGYNATKTILNPPGWVFVLNPEFYTRALTLMSWVNQNGKSTWSDYPTKPKIGTAGYNFSPAKDETSAVKDYCLAHPDQFEWVNDFIVPYGTVSWASAVEGLKDCDLVFMGVVGSLMPTTFVDQYRAAGGKAKFILSDAMPAYLGAVVDKVGWNAIDGAVGCLDWGWWTYDSTEIDLVRELLFKNHPNQALAIIHAGVGGVGGGVMAHYCVELIRAAVEKTGAKGFSSQAFYDLLTGDLSVQLPGYPELTFGDRRDGQHYMMMWRYSAADQNLIAASDWIHIE